MPKQIHWHQLDGGLARSAGYGPGCFLLLGGQAFASAVLPPSFLRGLQEIQLCSRSQLARRSGLAWIWDTAGAASPALTPDGAPAPGWVLPLGRTVLRSTEPSRWDPLARRGERSRASPSPGWDPPCHTEPAVLGSSVVTTK